MQFIVGTCIWITKRFGFQMSSNVLCGVIWIQMVCVDQQWSEDR